MAKFINPTKVITGVNTRWSYVNAWEPKSINGGHLSIPYLSLFLSLIQRQSRRSRQLFRRLMMKDRAS